MKERAIDILEYLETAAAFMGEFGIKFDINAVNRFMESCHKGESVSLADAQQVTVLLESLIHGAKKSAEINVGKELRNLFEIPRHRKKRYTPADIAPGSEAYQTVIDYVLAEANSAKDRKIRKTRHIDVVKKVAKILSVGDREAERIIAKIKEDILPALHAAETEEYD
jgi:hypothetical protein